MEEKKTIGNCTIFVIYLWFDKTIKYIIALPLCAYMCVCQITVLKIKCLTIYVFRFENC